MRSTQEYAPEEETLIDNNNFARLRAKVDSINEDNGVTAMDILNIIRNRKRNENEKQTLMDALTNVRTRRLNEKSADSLFASLTPDAAMQELNPQLEITGIVNTMSAYNGTTAIVGNNPPYQFANGTGSTNYMDLSSILDTLKEDIASLKNQIAELKNENPDTLKFDGKMLAQTAPEDSYLVFNSDSGLSYTPYIHTMIVNTDDKRNPSVQSFDYAMEILK